MIRGFSTNRLLIVASRPEALELHLESMLLDLVIYLREESV